MKYEELTVADKETLKNVYYSKNVSMKELLHYLPFPISYRTLKKVLIQDWNINTRRKNKYTLNEDYFSKIDTSEKAYILGFLAADGSVLRDSNGIVFSNNNFDILNKIKFAIEFSGNVRLGNCGGFDNSRSGYVLNFSSSKMKQDLKQYGILPCKSLSFDNIPDLIPERFKRHFLRGYFDGDGCVFLTTNTFKKKEKEYSYKKLKINIIATKKFIDDCIQTFDIKHYSITDSKTEHLSYMTISKKSEVLKLFHLMYDDATLFLQYKYDIFIQNFECLL